MNLSEAELREIAKYAPIGLAALIVEQLLPVVKAESINLRQQVPVARFIGQMATQQAQVQIRNRRDLRQDQLKSLFNKGNSVMTQICGCSQDRRKGSDSTEVNALSDTPKASGRSAKASLQSDVDANTGSTSDIRPLELRAIEGYNNLSAPQIIGLLEDLSVNELEEVANYERKNRQRRTILNRIAQLRII